MAVYPQSAVGLNYITYPAGPTAAGTTITANAAANTKGTYTQIVASTAFTCVYVVVTVQSTAATVGLQYRLDIATGAAASEVVVIPDLLAEGTNTATSVIGGTYEFPLAISSGTRIAARCQCSTGSQALAVTITLIAAGGQPGITTFTNYGAGVTHSSGGAQVDPGGTANTKGAYTQLTASTTGVIQWLCAMVTIGGATFNTSSALWCIDIATGAGGAEVVLIPDLRIVVDCGATPRPVVHPRSFACLTYIASGTRLAVRASCSTNDATNRLFDIAIVGGTAPAESSGGGSFPFCG